MITKLITKESAIHMAKHICLSQAETRTDLSFIKKMALKTAANGDGLQDIFDTLYELGFVVAADASRPHIQNYFAQGALIEQK